MKCYYNVLFLRQILCGFDLIGFDAKIYEGFFFSKEGKCGVMVLHSLYYTLHF